MSTLVVKIGLATLLVGLGTASIAVTIGMRGTASPSVSRSVPAAFPAATSAEPPRSSALQPVLAAPSALAARSRESAAPTARKSGPVAVVAPARHESVTETPAAGHSLSMNLKPLFATFVLGTATATTVTASKADSPSFTTEDLAPPKPRGPERSGFTLEVGAGVSQVVVMQRHRSSAELTYDPLSISVGAFVTPRLAIMARMAGAGMGQGRALGAFYGVVVQYWLLPDLFVGAGAGAALLRPAYDIEGPIPALRWGVGAEARIGYSFATFKHHSLAATLEVFPSVLGDATSMATTLNLQWQLH